MSARNATSRPTGIKTSPSPAAAIPNSSAGDTAGNARRLAGTVTPGTAWKWNSRIGVTASCAASVAPAASPTGRGRNRRRSAMGVASATIPAVATTESWNPIAHTSPGSRTISARTADASTDAASRGRPISVPTSAIVAITPARITDGSPPVSTTKNTTTPRQSRNRGHRVRPISAASARIGAITIATFSPETTRRWPSPAAEKSRESPGSSCESSPSTRPSRSPASFGGNSRAMERPTNPRTTWVMRTNALGEGPRRTTSDADSETAIPRRRSDSANPGSSGTRNPPSTPDQVAPDGGRWIAVAVHPHRLVDGGRSPGPPHLDRVHDRRPAER